MKPEDIEKHHEELEKLKSKSRLADEKARELNSAFIEKHQDDLLGRWWKIDQGVSPRFFRPEKVDRQGFRHPHTGMPYLIGTYVDCITEGMLSIAREQGEYVESYWEPATEHDVKDLMTEFVGQVKFGEQSE